MDLDFLKNEIIPKRVQEIEEGKNLCTRQPIYVVLDLQENIVSGHTEYGLSTNYKGIGMEYGFIDVSIDSESREFFETDEWMESPEEVTRFYTDRVVSFFLTSEAAHEYMVYQKHNLTNPYVYVFDSGYGNKQMDKFLRGC